MSDLDLGLSTSRMKDIYDLWRIGQYSGLDDEEVGLAIRRTFERRGTPVAGTPVVFSDAFWLDPGKQAQWRGFLGRSGLRGPELRAACRAVAERYSHFFGG